VDTFYALGQRIAQLTYNMQSRTGADFLENRDSGLTAFGSQIIQRMERVGMIVDLSHCGTVANQPNFARDNAYFADNGGAHVEGLDHPRRLFGLPLHFRTPR
jgi:hypothetical protein